jgi:uncharacterized protein
VSKPREITIQTARRLAIRKQRLAGPRPSGDAGGILEVVRDLGCLQIDPISVVERTQLLVLRSRLGQYSPADLDKLVFEDRCLFEYWAHAASLVLTEDYPIHSLMMRRWQVGESGWARETAEWIETNAALRDAVLAQLRDNGPLPSRQLEGTAAKGWGSSGWTNERNVSRMLDFLWFRGTIMVAGRAGGQKLWDLAERVLPPWTPREVLEEREVVRRAAQKSLRALGVARPEEIKLHFTRDRYPGLPEVLAELEREGTVMQVNVSNDEGAPMRGKWYVHSEDVDMLDAIEVDEWEGRTTLLSPFDNLICDRKRTEQMWGFRYRIEIYVPAAKREFGYYVLPILHGDRLIGRIDPRTDRKAGRLHINAVYAEPDAPQDETTARSVATAINDLAQFLGATDIEFTGRVPAAWQSALT